MNADYLALWKRMDKVVMALTHKANTLPKRFPKRRKLRAEIIDYADYLMADFFCCFEDGVGLEWHVKWAEQYAKDKYKIDLDKEV